MISNLSSATVPASASHSRTEAIYAAGLTLMGVLVMLVYGGWLQAQVHLNHDVSWITHSARWLLEGRRFGSDIVDPNPPLIWFLSLPAAALASAGLLPEATAMRLYTWLLCLGSLAFCHHLLRPLRQEHKHWESAAIVLAAAYSMTVIPAASFAQREYFAFVLGLPYCLLVAARIRHAACFSRGVAVAAGVLAGIGFGFKPWLLAVPFAVEVVHLIHARSWRSVWRPETVAMGAFLVAYLATVVMFTDYLTFAVPLIRATYWAYDTAQTVRLWPAWREAVVGPLLPAAVMFGASRSFSPHVRVLLAALAGFSFNYWSQRKGFVYHLYPVRAVAPVILAYAAVVAIRKTKELPARFAAWSRVALVAMIVLLTYRQFLSSLQETGYWLQRFGIEIGATGRSRQALIDRLNRLAPEPDTHVFAFSTHPYPGFPSLSYSHVQWASAYPAQFVIPAAVKRATISDAELRKKIDWAVTVQREAVLADFIRNKPDVVLLDAAPRRLGLGYKFFDDIAFYCQDPRFAAVWRRYLEVEKVSGVRIFVRTAAE